VLTEYATAGRIEEGQLVLEERIAFRTAMRHFKPGPVVVKVERMQHQRSISQNKYLHGVVFRILADYFGDSIEATKSDCMGHYWGWQPSKFNPACMVPTRPSTASMTTVECSEFIDWIVPWALITFGVEIPLPNEYLQVAEDKDGADRVSPV
jgi:hypothetical protein